MMMMFSCSLSCSSSCSLSCGVFAVMCLVPQGSGQLQTPASSQPAVREDDRTGSIYVQGRGTVMTYMFEVKLLRDV